MSESAEAVPPGRGAPGRRPGRGRPEATDHASIERAAFRLFADRGFEGTTLDDIADAVGVSRRTLFRYYSSKNDIPWGRFDGTLAEFRRLLEATPEEVPLWAAVHRGVRGFNDFPAAADPPHETRMRLILHTPALQAHSVLRYAQWREVIAGYVGSRRGLPADALLPQAVAHVALAVSVSAYERWLRDTAQDLLALVDDAAGVLQDVLADNG